MDRYINFISDNWYLFASLAIIVALLVRSFVASKLSGVPSLTVPEAVRLLNADNTVLIDVRLDGEYKKGHIAKAVHIPLGALDSRIREIEKHRENNIVVSCQTGQRSLKAAQILRKHGFANVHNLTGGLNAWNDANMPVTKK